jgi:DNA helicase-2/ATP-dependent DNA helicase PcrA
MLWVGLNQYQRDAIVAQQGRFVLAATAGSGKTRVVVLRIDHLIASGVDPARIGAFTFSRDAAAEMNNRAALLGLGNMRIGTLHSLCWEIVQSDHARSFGGPDLELAESQLHFYTKNLIAQDYKDRDLDVGEANRIFKLAKAHGLSFHPAQPTIPGEEILAFFKKKLTKHWLAPSYVAVYQQVETFRHASRIVSYDDMLTIAYLYLTHVPLARTAWSERFEYLIVDEAQDSSWVQNAVVDMIVSQCANVMYVGDVQQSIYRWRGANPDDFVSFSKQYHKMVLPVNYRSTQEICRHATLLTHNEAWNVTGPTLAHEGAPSDPESIQAIEYANAQQEATTIADQIKTLVDTGTPARDVAVLYRVTYLMPTVEEALLKAGIPYVVWSGATFYARKEVRDLLAYVRVAAIRDHDGSETRRALLAPFRYIGNKIIAEAEAYASQHNVALLDALGKATMGKGQKQKFAAFKKTLTKVNEMLCTPNTGPAQILEFVVEDTNYDGYVSSQAGQEGPDPDSGGSANIHKLIDVAGSFKNTIEFLDYIDQTQAALEQSRGKRTADAVVLSSIHKSKGLEWDHVFGIGWNDTILPHMLNPDQGEELRLAYVCMTRARKRFTASYLRTVITPRGAFPGQPSPYIGKAQLPVVKR